MTKDFDTWNEKKKQIEKHPSVPNIHVREVWWVSLGLNIGSEEDGKNFHFERPVLIIKKYNENMVLILPLSGKRKPSRYRFPVSVGENQSDVLLSQPRLISTKRMIRKVAKLMDHNFEAVLQAFIESLI